MPSTVHPTVLTLLLTLLTLLSLASAWKMDVNYSDGTQLHKHGHHNSHCKRFNKTDAAITSVVFEGSLLADTFVLYNDGHCRDESYKGKKGNNNVPNHVYRSYKVY
ncbi:hypothetical protein BDZ91DRAFT_828709 [Kalaharituber pfeilii]|nr:hypothetical protein BDZ91DRAFT_828709 [Kalaharituber pfeilii]